MSPPARQVGSGPLRIAVLDDYPLLSPAYFDTLPKDVVAKFTADIYTDTLPPGSSELVDRLKSYEVIITMRERTPFPASLIEQLPDLKYLMTTGLRNLALDIPSFTAHGILVSGTPAPKVASGISATAQHTWALILALADNVPRDDHQTRREGRWLSSSTLNVGLAGKTLGLLGLGKLGAEVAKIGSVFGMDVIAWSENLTQDKADDAASRAGQAKGAWKAVSKDELFAQADVLSVHVVLGDRTRGLVSEKELGQMKESAMLVNTSRGPIIQQDALLEVLKRGRLRGAALDVFDVEPLPVDSLWRTTKWGEDGASQVVVTPHSGYAFEETMRHMWEHTMANLTRYVQGAEVVDKLT
jgi:glycerate dehydrogenase